MAYADFDFYENVYYGDSITDADFSRLAERATEYIDALTFERLVDGLPTDERAQTKVKKAVCAAAEVLYDIEIAEKVGRYAAGTASGAADGSAQGALSSRSAGSESESYASLSQQADGAKAWNAAYGAAGNPRSTARLVFQAVRKYLTGVTDDNGVLLLYSGL